MSYLSTLNGCALPITGNSRITAKRIVAANLRLLIMPPRFQRNCIPFRQRNGGPQLGKRWAATQGPSQDGATNRFAVARVTAKKVNPAAQSRIRKERSLMFKVRFVGLDVHADTIAVAVAEAGGE